MFIELTELLTCPRCPATAGLVALVDRMEGRRVLEGSLGCPFCEARFPVRGGEVDLTGEPPTPANSTAPEESPPAHSESLAEDTLVVAALLGLQGRGGGYVLLGEGLAGIADRLSALAPGVEIVALAAPGAPAAGERAPAAAEETGRVSRVRVGASLPLPLRPSRLRAAALHGEAAGRLGDVEEALVPGGRLAVLRPSGALESEIAAGALRVLAAEARALVAVKEAAPQAD